MILRSLLILLLLPAISTAQASRDVEAIERAAARHLLARHPSWSVHLDAAFAEPRTAPGVRSSVARPQHRTLLLADSLRAIVSSQRAETTVHLMLSDPVVRGDTATVSVTVDYLRPHGRRRGFYETIEVVLARTANGWHVIGETQLGIV